MRDRMTQKQIILNILREAKEPVPSYNLEKVSTKWGWLGTSGLKRCRELEVEGKIHKSYKDGYVWYESEPPQRIVEYRDPITKELRHREVIY